MKPWDPPLTPLDRVASVFRWTVGALWLVPMMAAMMAASLVARPDRTEWLSRLYCRGQVWLAGCRWRAVVDPAVDPRTPYIFVQNHTNLLDHVVLYPATPHFKQGLELEKHFRYPVYGWFMRSRGTIPVKRAVRGQVDDLKSRIAAEIALGHSILVFPEGTRTLDGRVGRFRKGAFVIARDLGVPVVPVAVTGWYDVMRKGSLILRGGQDVTVWVGAPIPTAGLDDAALEGVVRTAQATVSERIDAYWAAKEHNR